MKYSIFIFSIIIMASLFFAGCSNEPVNSTGKVIKTDTMIDNQENLNREINIDKLEIIHFHAARQCYSCVTLGDYAKETVQTYFADELEKGIITFEHMNGEDPNNREKVIKYGATGSSLWFGVYNDDEFHAEQNIDVWYKLSNKKAYMDYLKGYIEKELEGN